MNNIPGFASAQRQWENMEPKDSGCDCPQLYMCQRCEEYALTEGVCECNEDWVEGEPQAVFVEIDREDIEFEAVSSCPQHGFCTGCTRRNCEDCGGDDWDDR